jgi:hypothetical protein
MTIALENKFAKLPIVEIMKSMETHIQPFLGMLPDKRMKAVIGQMLLGILGGQTPLITGMARSNTKASGETWAIAKRMYRLMANERLKTSVIYQGLYRVGQKVVERENPEYLVVAVDPVNFEKPYTEALEGVSVIHKATPPDLAGHARLARGYPAITATIVNTQVPVTSYANWFSYQTVDFISQNKELEQAFETTHRLYGGRSIRFVGDSGLDDQKMFAVVAKLGQEFVFRVSHLERIVEVYNDRLDRWETEKLQDLVESVPYQATFQVLFKHAGETRFDTVHFGWFRVRIPGTQEALWILVADDETLNRQLILITNVPLTSVSAVQQLYPDWRLRTRIEHGYRFDQEQGLDVENMRVQTVERMRRLFAIVLMAAQIVFVISEQWPPKALLWLRQLGGKLGIPTDRDGPYWLLQGISAVIVTCMTLSFIFLHPFPSQEFTCG